MSWLLALVMCATPRVVYVAVDGLRPDAVQRFELTALARLAEQGTAAAGLVPRSPSSTFPNLYTLATGLEPKAHGIVANAFEGYGVDVKGSLQDPRFYKGTPLWVAQPDTAVVMWLGAEAVGTPARLQPFVRDMDSKTRTDRLLAFLGEGHRLSMLYLDAVDRAEHKSGPFSSAARAAARDVDAQIARIVAALDLSRDAIVVVSDHGMSVKLGGGGTHGEDPAHPAMWGTFIAAGAGVPHQRLAPFANTQVYGIVLGLMTGGLTWPEKTRARPMVRHRVFVPGYKGSVLKDETGEVAFLTLWQALGLRTPSLRRERTLHADGAIARVGPTDIYGSWTKSAPMHVFAYDWRQSNLTSLDALVAYLRTLDGPVEIIGHSMGGMLALAATHKIDVAMVSLVGAPIQAGPGFMPDLMTGNAVGLNRKLISPDVCRTFASVYAFFPPPYYDVGKWQALGNTTVTQAMLDDARAFRTLVEAPSKAYTRIVYSRAHKTLTSAGPDNPGDGRVGAEDAFPARFDEVYETDAEHAVLLNDKAVREFLLTERVE